MFISKNLTEIEPRCHRLIALSLREYKYRDLQSSLDSIKILPKGYQFYYDRTARDMIEFHIENHHRLQEFASKRWKFGEINIMQNVNHDTWPR